jgi:CRISPR type III-A-associated protein Csm2
MSTQVKQKCEYPQVKLENKPEWITESINDETIQWCENFGKYLAGKLHQNKFEIKPLTSTQLRRFFGALKRLSIYGYSSQKYHELLRLKPMLAYAVGRDKDDRKFNKTGIFIFYEEITSAIDLMKGKGEKEFKNFVHIVEAIVAYHKAAGGE